MGGWVEIRGPSTFDVEKILNFGGSVETHTLHCVGLSLQDRQVLRLEQESLRDTCRAMGLAEWDRERVGGRGRIGGG